MNWLVKWWRGLTVYEQPKLPVRPIDPPLAELTVEMSGDGLSYCLLNLLREAYSYMCADPDGFCRFGCCVEYELVENEFRIGKNEKVTLDMPPFLIKIDYQYYPGAVDYVSGWTYESREEYLTRLYLLCAETGDMVDIDTLTPAVRNKAIETMKESLQPLYKAVCKHMVKSAKQKKIDEAAAIAQTTKHQQQVQSERDRLAQDIINRHQPPPE